MKKWRIEVIVGIILILVCPYIPNSYYNFLFDKGFAEIALYGVTPTIAIVGVMIFIIGITDHNKNI